MAAGEAIPITTDAAVLSAVVGPATLARGRAYAAGGAVIARTEEVSGVVVGSVQGSRVEPYEVVIRLSRDADGRLSKMEGDCTCPVGWNCKHCVAVLLSAPGAPKRAAVSAPAALTPAALTPATPKPAVPARTAPKPASQAQWTKLLGALLNDGVHQVEAPADLGLQLELVAQRPRPVRRNEASKAPEPGIRLRPVLQSDRGNWVRTGVSWSRLSYLGYGYRHGPAQERVDVLRELQALAGVGQTGGWRSYGDEVIWLESINSRRLWDLLRQAAEVGVPLLGSGKAGGAVVLDEEPAELVLDLSAGDAAGHGDGDGEHLTLQPLIGDDKNDKNDKNARTTRTARTGRIPRRRRATCSSAGRRTAWPAGPARSSRTRRRPSA